MRPNTTVRALCLSATLISCAHAQFAEPDAAELTAMISRMRAAALSYTDRLQDFICDQRMRRSTDTSGSGKHWKLLENQETELTYVSHKENYKLLSVNGDTTNLEKRIKKGYFKPGGEFGSALQKIFSPKANAEFAWDHGEVADGKRSCVFRYNVPRPTTTLVIQVNLQYVRLGHHGLVYADCDTGAVTHFQTESEVRTVKEQGRDIEIGNDLEVYYGPVTIGSKEFLLPREAKEINRFYTRLTKAEIQFQQYRKYDANSTIEFGEGEAKPPGKE